LRKKHDRKDSLKGPKAFEKRDSNVPASTRRTNDQQFPSLHGSVSAYTPQISDRKSKGLTTSAAPTGAPKPSKKASRRNFSKVGSTTQSSISLIQPAENEIEMKKRVSVRSGKSGKVTVKQHKKPVTGLNLARLPIPGSPAPTSKRQVKETPQDLASRAKLISSSASQANQSSAKQAIQ